MTSYIVVLSSCNTLKELSEQSKTSEMMKMCHLWACQKEIVFIKDVPSIILVHLSVPTEVSTGTRVGEKGPEVTCVLCGQKICNEVYKANWNTRAFTFERQECLVLFGKLTSIYGESFVSVLPNQ
jgi:hypothetical protein